MFKCTHCYKVFKDEKYLITHQFDEHFVKSHEGSFCNLETLSESVGVDGKWVKTDYHAKCHRRGPSTIGLVQKLKSRQGVKIDGRRTAKKDEDIRVEWICKQINDETDIGLKIKERYFNKFEKQISHAEKKGNNKDHYDILIHHTDRTTKRCEEKGTKHYSEYIDASTPPHEHSVEFYNGPGKKFSISKKYLKLWYDNNVNNIYIKEKYKLPEIPLFEEWLEGGPYCMIKDPTSEYSILIKKNYRQLYPKKSMNGWGHDNIDYRIKPNNKFNITDKEKKILIKEVQEIYTDVMNQKDVWLQTTGLIDGEFSFKWFDKIKPKKIVDVKVVKKKDIEFIFVLEDNSSFTGIMRWGKGCGFSCFRMDFK